MANSTTDNDAYKYLKNSPGMYRPRTQKTALIAVENSLLPPAAFIFKSVNVKPIFEEPYDLAEIDRILAKRDLGIDTILLLMNILGKLIKNSDPEIALFAAESINTIENRYNERIQDIKDRLEEEERQPVFLRTLIDAYVELSQINRIRQVLRNFYLSEAYQYCKILWRFADLGIADYQRMVHILLALGLFGQSEVLLSRALPLRPDLDTGLRLLQLETAFAQRNRTKIAEIIDALEDIQLDEQGQLTLAFWEGATNDE